MFVNLTKVGLFNKLPKILYNFISANDCKKDALVY